MKTPRLEAGKSRSGGDAVRRKAKSVNDEPLYRRRREHKWLVTPDDGRVVENAVARGVPLVRHAGSDESRVVSLYLDHEDGGLWRRAKASPGDCVKLRLRAYLSPEGTSDAFVFEIKQSAGGTTSKRRVGVDPASLALLCAGDFDALDPTLLTAPQRALLARRALRPAVFVSYRRRVYQQDDRLRVTFDRDVAWHRPPGDVRAALLAVSRGLADTARGGLGRVVVEVKLAQGEPPAFLRDALGGRPRALGFSKFVAAAGQDPVARQRTRQEAQENVDRL